ncbi:hypothetical protein [Sodaliphilus sp.]|uniref:hypothetical protein n=1 Tax=Sodaliphilus sp. TaxID=2815818 RepID=UPI00388DD6B5
METSLVTTFSPLMFSSGVPDFEFQSRARELEVSIMAGADVLLNVVQTPFDGIVHIYEVRELIEDFMRISGTSSMDISIIAREDAGEFEELASFTVLYLDKDTDTDAATWCKNNFLTTAKSKRLVDNIADKLHAYSPDGESSELFYHITTQNAQGEVRVFDEKIQDIVLSEGGWFYHDVCLRDAMDIVGTDKKVLAVAVRLGARVMNFYVYNPLPTGAFYFRNCFNVVELALLQCTTTSHIKPTKKLASVRRNSVLYDCETKVSHEVETAPLSIDEIQWLDQLLSSHQVMLINGKEVVIFEGDSEESDNNAATNRLKFSWQRTDARASLSAADNDARIFQDPYSYQFD